MGKSLSGNLTTYDLLKTLAVVLMIIDHIGFFFFPGDMMWRAAGRICVPIWFFLIGYANSRDIPWQWVAGALILEMCNITVGMSVFPLDILFTLILVRLSIDAIMAHGKKGFHQLWGMSLIFAFIGLPSNFLISYGTQGLILAMFGYLVRHRETIAKKETLFGYLVFAPGIYLFLQQLTFFFDETELAVMAGGTVAVSLLLFFFRAAELPKLTKYTPLPFRFVIKLMGRRTLEIYVLHLVLFKLTAAAVDLDLLEINMLSGIKDLDRFEWFDLLFFSPTGTR